MITCLAMVRGPYLTLPVASNSHVPTAHSLVCALKHGYCQAESTKRNGSPDDKAIKEMQTNQT